MNRNGGALVASEIQLVAVRFVVACTKGMIKDAASAGFYESPNKKKYPRVQLLTIEGLLSKKQRAAHPDYEPDLNFKKAKTEANAAQKELN